MKITRYAMMLAAATGLLSACQKLDEVKAYDPDKVDVYKRQVVTPVGVGGRLLRPCAAGNQYHCEK